MTDQSIIKLQDFEGLRLKPYQDTVGKWSIGWGRNLSDRGISYDEAKILLKDDIEIATAEARANFDWFDGLDPLRQDFIVLMIFNLGVPRLRTFRKMLDAIEAGNFSEAALQLEDSAWASQVTPRRAVPMRNLIEFGEWR